MGGTNRSERGTRMLDRVLVPVELSATDSRMIAFARGLERYGVAETLLLHAADLVGVERPVAVRQESELQQQLHRLATCVDDDRCMVPVLEAGEPQGVILRAARDREADMIVCATRAKSVLDEFALGSVSEALARHAAVPVLLVPFHALADASAQDAIDMGAHVFDRIHFPTDFSEVSEHTFDYLKRLGPERVSEVLVSHGMDGHYGNDVASSAAHRTAMRLLTAMCGELAEVGMHGDGRLMDGHVVDALLDLTAREGATCIAIGSQGHSMGEELLLGSVSLSVLRRSPVPVLLLR